MMDIGTNMTWNSGWQMGWMGFGGIFLVLGILFLAWVAFRPRTNSGIETPEKILKRRYAAGEIGSAEYADKLKNLSIQKRRP